MGLDRHFNEYFGALDRTGGGADRCFLCRRTPSDVKLFFGFHEDGTPIDAAQYGLEDVTLEELDIMSYRGARPVCAVCQLNYDVIFLADGHEVVQRVLREMEHERDRLWPRSSEASPKDADENTGGK